MANVQYATQSSPFWFNVFEYEFFDTSFHLNQSCRSKIKKVCLALNAHLVLVIYEVRMNSSWVHTNAFILCQVWR